MDRATMSVSGKSVDNYVDNCVEIQTFCNWVWKYEEFFVILQPIEI